MEHFLDGVVLGLHLVSAHFPAGDGVNNVNLGVYARTESGFTVGAYRNTLRRTSVYAGWTFTTEAVSRDLPVSLTVGVVSGYKAERMRVACAPGSYASACYDRVGFSEGAWTVMAAPSVALPGFALLGGVPRISYVPRIGGPGRHHAVHLSAEVKF